MGLLRSAGITFSDTSQLNSKFGIIPQTTTMLFYQATAPVGWTKATTHDNKALRVVSGVGSAIGGTNSFTNSFPNNIITVNGTVSVAATVGDHTLILSEIASHAHAAGGSNGSFRSGPATPSRYSARAPISYGFRFPYRQPVSNRQPSTYRQPGTYRQPNSFRQPNQARVPQVNRVPIVYRQPNQVRLPQASRQIKNYRQPFSYRQANSVRAVRNYGQLITNRQPNRIPQRVPIVQRIPRQVPYRTPQGGNPRRQPNPNERRFEKIYSFRITQRNVVRERTKRGRQANRQANRIPISNTNRLAQPFNNRVPFINGSVRLPNIRNYRQANSFRQPNTIDQRNILSYRRPIASRFVQSNRNPVSGRTPIAIRYVQNARIAQNNRVPITSRLPQVSRVIQYSRVLINQRTIVPQRTIVSQRTIVNSRIDVRSPIVSNVRYVSRVLVPGGQIRSDNNLGPNTSLVGGGQAHSHTFTSDNVPYNYSIDLRVRYIDVILCNFVG